MKIEKAYLNMFFFHQQIEIFHDNQKNSIHTKLFLNHFEENMFKSFCTVGLTFFSEFFYFYFFFIKIAFIYKTC